MAEPYPPVSPSSTTPSGAPATNIRVGMAVPKSRSGLGIGMLVAAVFAVVGLLAYGILGNRDVAAPAAAPPVVVIDATPAPATPPAASVPAPAAPSVPAVPAPVAPSKTP